MKIQPLNYWGQARKDVLRDISHYPFEVDKSNLQTVIKLGDQSVKFFLPDEGKLISHSKYVEYSQEAMETLGIPYSPTLLEFSSINSAASVIDGQEGIPSTKRIAIVCTLSQYLHLLGNSLSQESADAITHILKTTEGERRLLVVGVSYLDTGKKWSVMPYGMVLDLNTPTTDTEKMLEMQQRYNLKVRANIQVSAIPLLPQSLEILRRRAFSYSQETMYKDMATEVSATMDLIQVLSCSNVTAKPITHVGDSLNRRRIASGKVPLYEYKVLTVDMGGVRYKQSDRPDDYQSDRNSPREHLRRGHIRQCRSGVRVWVQPCVVGSRAHGVIEKDYAIGFSH